jgi:hypothetical protein
MVLRMVVLKAKADTHTRSGTESRLWGLLTVDPQASDTDTQMLGLGIVVTSRKNLR